MRIRTLTLILFITLLSGLLYLDAHHVQRHGDHAIYAANVLDADELGARERWDLLRLRDPKTGEIPRGIHARELAFAETIGSSRYSAKEVQTIGTTGWRSAGPINAGGRTRAIGIDIANPANVLIATAMGGIFKSTDSGRSWTRRSAPGALKDMTCLTQDHRTGKTSAWYAGTGEYASTTFRRVATNIGANVRTVDIGDGIYKSTDNGATWNILASTHDVTETVLDSTFDIVWNVAVDNSKTSSDIVYAATFGAIMRSTDGGGTWTRALGDIANPSIATDVAVTSTGVAYAYLSAQTASGGTSSAAGIWRSVDVGQHWTRITPTDWPAGSQRMRFAIAPSNENILYIGGLAQANGFTPILYRYTYLSGDGSGAGGAWDNRSANIPQTDGAVSSVGINTYVGYALVLRVFPTDPNVIVMGGTNLFRSTDGFATTNNTDWIGGYGPTGSGAFTYPNHHPDNHDLVFSPIDPHIAYSSNDGGMFMTYDILGQESQFPVTWNDVNTNDCASIIYVVGLDHATPGDSSLIGGFQDQGSWLGQEGQMWQQTTGGDGCYCAIADHGTALYSSSQYGYIYQYIVATQQWNGVTGNGAPNAQFVTPWMLDPTNSGTMFLAAGPQLQRNSTLMSGGGTWEDLAGCTAPTGTISAIAMSVVPSHRLYFGTSDGKLFRVDSAESASPSTSELTGSIFPSGAFVSCVSVDPQNADSIIVCFSNYHVISLFASSDGGKTWRNISGDLEQNPDGSGDGPSTRWVSVVHQGGQTLFLVGTSVGLFSTTDIAGTNVNWQPEGLSGFGRTIVENIDVRQSDGFVAIATQGSGIWVTNVSALARSVGTQAKFAGSLSLSPDPADHYSNIALTLPHSQHVRISIIDSKGAVRSVLREGTFEAGETEVQVDCSRLPSGAYFVQAQVGDAIETKRLIVQR